MSMNVIILAAGLSTRMGDGGNKLLMPIVGRPLLAWTLEHALEYTKSIWVVTGHMKTEMDAFLSSYPVHLIHNPDYGTGQESSIRAALSVVDGPLMILPGDLPLIRKADYEDCGRHLEGHLAARPFTREGAGHPVALSQDLVMMYRKDKSTRLRDLVRFNAHDFYQAGPNVRTDVDTKADLVKVTRMLEAKGN